MEFAGVRVPMTSQDRARIARECNANPDFASLILLGFKNRGSIPFTHTMENAYFIYPTIDDDGNNGGDDPAKNSSSSNCVSFAHLHASMRRKNALAIGEFLTRVSARSRLVAVWPLEEGKYGDEGITTQPPGMVVLCLPFEDEVRALEPDAAIVALQERQLADGTKQEGGTDHGSGDVDGESAPVSVCSKELVEAAVRMVQKQTIPDAEIGENFENAALLRFWDYVEHVALEEAAPAKGVYDTEPDPEQILAVVGDEVERFTSHLPEDIKLPKKSTTSRKRAPPGPDNSGIDWETLYHEDRLHECKNDELKKKLKSLGAAVSGKKDDLVDRLRPFLEEDFRGVGGGSSKIKAEETMVKMEE